MFNDSLPKARASRCLGDETPSYSALPQDSFICLSETLQAIDHWDTFAAERDVKRQQTLTFPKESGTQNLIKLSARSMLQPRSLPLGRLSHQMNSGIGSSGLEA
jgi:hypothetical protein